MYKGNSKTTNPPNSLPLPYTQLPASQPAKKEPRQPMRTSKLGNKLKVLPTHAEAIAEENEDDEDPDELEDDDERGAIQFYTPLSQIPAGTARRDAQRLTKTEKAKLPRVTAYCTAANYDLPALLAYLSARPDAYRCHPRLFDTECVHTPYLPPPSSSSHPHSAKATPSSPRLRPQVPEGDLLNLDPSSTQAAERELERKKKRQTGFSKRPGAKRGKSGGSTAAEDSEDDDWEEEEWVPDVFVFEYGTVVVWGMTEKEEKRLLNSFRKFEIERLSAEDVEMEDLNFYYADYSRIYNDVITLRKGSSYMTKLSLSHALSQSVKISLFEELISSTIEQTKDLPKSLSETGKIGMPRSEIMKQIGNLFILRININLVGSILDSPEFFWSFPDLEPLYNAARSYLEISQRIDLLNARVDVLQDMLKLLKESVNSSHGERLEAIVIFLIAIEIVLGIITILVDLSFS